MMGDATGSRSGASPDLPANAESGIAGERERGTLSGSAPVADQGVKLAVEKDLAALDASDAARLLDRGRASDESVENAVRVIVSDVRRRGDEALRGLARRFDHVDLVALEVPRSACDQALNELDGPVRGALERAASNIAAFHRAQLPPPLEVEVEAGVRLGRRAEPLRRVAVYAPGGRAAYPSSVLMGVVPARVAGVEEVIVCSPPGPDGRPPAEVLAACALAGADRVFALGGAGAIAAVAYGTATVPRVDKVVGPGNAYVTEAKRQLNGVLAIDCPAGPSEVLILADATADPRLVAAEVVAQAEHDPDAVAVVVCTDPAVLAEVRRELDQLVPVQPRRDIVHAALAARGALLLADTLDEAISFANRYAPEHLLVLVRKPRAVLDRLRGAGSIFLGPGSSVAFGDYLTGANHVLPTAGLARAYAGLSTMDFLRWYTYQEVSPEGAARLAGDTAILAQAEGLPGHALCARLRRRTADATMGRRDDTTTGGPPSAGDSESPAAGAENGRVASSSPRVVVSAMARSSPVSGAAPAALPFRAAYAAIELYDPKRTPVEVDLSDNTSLFGAPPSALRALRSLGEAAVTRYPPVYADELKRALAELHGVEPENVVTGCGSDDVIDSAIRAFCEPGDVVAYPDPTFSMLPLFARMNATRPVGVPLGPGFELDDTGLLSARGRITYICNPNNPTGTLFPMDRVRRVAREAAGVVLVDEAYADYAGSGDVSLIGDVVGSERAVVLRTLSKSFGLAGLRVGYAIGPVTLVREIEKSRGPYKIGAAADATALAALREDRAWAEANAGVVRESRARLSEELAVLGLQTWASSANFLLVRTPTGAPGSAPALAAALRERGVAVRGFPGIRQAGDCVRVSVGPWPVMARFLVALRGAIPAVEERA